MARFAMRTCWLASSIRLVRATRPRRREAARTLVEQSAVDLEDDLQMARQQHSNHASGHFSSASGSSVWFV
jgi:hypothetical protein